MFSATAANLRSLFCGWKFLKLLKRLTVGQAVPEIPLSIGSKLELLHRAFVFANFRILSRTLTHLSAYAYCCCILAVYTTEAPRFSAASNRYIYALLPKDNCCRLQTCNV